MPQVRMGVPYIIPGTIQSIQVRSLRSQMGKGDRTWQMNLESTNMLTMVL